MFFMNVNPSHAARSCIQIFISAPAGEVHVPGVHRHFNITGSMCKVEATISTGLMCGLYDRWHIKYLPVIIIKSAEEHSRTRLSVLFNCADNIFMPYQVLSFFWLHFDNCISRIETMELHL